MDRQRRLKRKRVAKQRKHVENNPGELLVFGATTAAVKKIWMLKPKDDSGFYITGDETKPVAPQDQP
ncbi:unnamed protein product [marine sediment metagenome]|uniref:Uncharacterized protein n=1 Tax=marine sediment metagenome TaxID=412755 RepID=X0YS40_9ZZZZ